jgi:hypothetical protein
MGSHNNIDWYDIMKSLEVSRNLTLPSNLEENDAIVVRNIIIEELKRLFAGLSPRDIDFTVETNVMNNNYLKDVITCHGDNSQSLYGRYNLYGCEQPFYWKDDHEKRGYDGDFYNSPCCSRTGEFPIFKSDEFPLIIRNESSDIYIDDQNKVTIWDIYPSPSYKYLEDYQKDILPLMWIDITRSYNAYSQGVSVISTIYDFTKNNVAFFNTKLKVFDNGTLDYLQGFDPNKDNNLICTKIYDDLNNTTDNYIDITSLPIIKDKNGKIISTRHFIGSSIRGYVNRNGFMKLFMPDGGISFYQVVLNSSGQLTYLDTSNIDKLQIKE